MAKLKVAVFGAGGILGQTMRLCQPTGCDVRYYRRKSDRLHRGIDLTDAAEVEEELNRFRPDAILNLAGENRPDVVERDPAASYGVNVLAPARLADWCDDNPPGFYVHVSTQAIFDGEDPPYIPFSDACPVNAYGQQKTEAERLVSFRKNWLIVRPTFVLGVRPLPRIGRENPVEQMLRTGDGRQVNDRWFSTVTARAAACELWKLVAPSGRERRLHQHIVHLGGPNRVSRYELAQALGCPAEAVSHSEFVGLAPRPRDTTYFEPTRAHARETDCPSLRQEWLSRAARDGAQAARELALFFGMQETVAAALLGRGFQYHHAAIADEYRRAQPETSAQQLLDWYRTTEGYIWELTAYHLADGFNYRGMVEGLASEVKGLRVLCLADGVGEATLMLRQRGVDAVYHDLAGSRTAEFAEFRFWLHQGEPGEVLLSEDWTPRLPRDGFDAVLCLDFLEHAPNVRAWVEAIYDALRPEGRAFFQNGFAMGSGEDGSIPMHLALNDHWEKDWPPLMGEVGFLQEGTSNWWTKPV